MMKVMINVLVFTNEEETEMWPLNSYSSNRNVTNRMKMLTCHQKNIFVSTSSLGLSRRQIELFL